MTGTTLLSQHGSTCQAKKKGMIDSFLVEDITIVHLLIGFTKKKKIVLCRAKSGVFFLLLWAGQMLKMVEKQFWRLFQYVLNCSSDGSRTQLIFKCSSFFFFFFSFSLYYIEWLPFLTSFSWVIRCVNCLWVQGVIYWAHSYWYMHLTLFFNIWSTFFFKLQSKELAMWLLWIAELCGGVTIVSYPSINIHTPLLALVSPPPHLAKITSSFTYSPNSHKSTTLIT